MARKFEAALVLGHGQILDTTDTEREIRTNRPKGLPPRANSIFTKAVIIDSLESKSVDALMMKCSGDGHCTLRPSSL